MSSELTPERALRLGGFDLRYARLLAITVLGDTAVTLTDPNGDGNHHDVDHLYLWDGQWTAGSSSGGGTPDVFGAHGWGAYTPEGRPGVRYAYGRAEHRGRQLVTFDVPAGYIRRTSDDWWAGQPLQVTATDEGWWIWIERTDTDADRADDQ